ncbi:MAG: APC family permease [Bacteroidales bacterium]|nr:APC family permease [Bacteroidales bacterium]
MSTYKKNSLSLAGAVAMGTGVMIGAAIFALVGQVAELSGKLYPFAFLAGALIAGLSSYTYIKLSQTFPSAGGIAMYLTKAYGKGTLTASASLLMAFAMVINQSLVARTFGSYTLQLFGNDIDTMWAAALGVGLLILIFFINISGNDVIQKTSFVMALVKILGIVIFAAGGLWAASFSWGEIIPRNLSGNNPANDLLGAFALSVLAYAGFTTITTSGEEIKNPKKNVGRAIIISLIICTVIYFLVTLAVGFNLSVEELIDARDYALAEAVRPAYGTYGQWFTIGIAIIATASGLITNVFAVSRMTTMLTEMKLIPHSHFRMPGDIHKHMLVYTVVLAITLTILFDLTRIASIGIIFYLTMDLIIQWGVLRRLRNKINARPWVIILAIILDAIVLIAFLWARADDDLLIVIVSIVLMALLFAGERLFLTRWRQKFSADPPE